ncbi:hypothetical protein [Thalassobellus suaedae]|uniref:T9SS type A sorting domain-containing protein n=1 Tax=Thalassobellus suaedae TaxID=3074124 RepID=A0ABY9Y494_9FLAO|nr:hypothetical protein RHP49_00015 [Flavobacteriaceae bacterium HL-DH10]
MTRITNIFLIALLFVFTNSTAKTNAEINTSFSNFTYSNVQRVRIDFKMPDGFTRHLLLSFTKDNSASDGYDYGYDAINKDAYPYDLNWLVDNQRCTIQGVGAFDENKKYPFWMFMSQNGNIEIALDTLENFDTPIDIFIYDSLLNTYTQINSSNYAANIASGEYSDRFYITFKSESNSSISTAKNSLDVEENNMQNTKINYLSSSKELYINTNDVSVIKNINIYNIHGQSIMFVNQVNSKVIKIPMDRINANYAIVNIETDQGIINKKVLIN